MKLSTRSTYGMRALIELVLGGSRGPVSAALIAKRQNLSVDYLEQLLHRLKKQGVVRSIRGPRGGYVLAKDPQRITMADVVDILDGPNGHGTHHQHTPRFRQVVSANAVEAKAIYQHAQRIAQAVSRCVHERITESLGTITLQDLCDEVGTQAGEPLDHRYVFHI